MPQFFLNIVQWFVTLTPRKALTALMAGLCIYCLWVVYDNKSDFKDLQAKYDKLSESRLTDADGCNKRIDTLNARWEKRYEAYRDEREKELKQLASDNQQKIEALTERLYNITKANIK